jgi:glycolate oxidase
MQAFLGSKTAHRAEKLVSCLGESLPKGCLSVDPFERRLYARDLAPVPELLNRIFYKTLPDAVVLPLDALGVAETLYQSYQHRVPVTPRAAGTTSFSNSVAVRGGLVLDVGRLKAEPELDEARGTVRVGPAVTWAALEETLNRKGWAVRSYPSSAVSASVGGWVSTQGHGLGSLKYGPLVDQLVSLEVVLPGGEIRRLTAETDPPMAWFAAAEGTLGVITEVELAVRPRPVHQENILLAYKSVELLSQEAARLAWGYPNPFSLFFADAGYLHMVERAGFPGLPGLEANDRGGVLLACYQGETAETAIGMAGAEAYSGHILPEELAQEEWSTRFYHLRVKRAGPSLLAAELWLPIDRLGDYLDRVRRLGQRSRVAVGTYGLVVSSSQALVMSLYPCDQRRQVDFMMALGFTRKLQMLGARLGGRPYGVGLWNTPYLPQLFSRPELAELRQRKARLDPLGLFNPGKLYRSEFPLWPALFGLGTEILAAGYSLFSRRQL